MPNMSRNFFLAELILAFFFLHGDKHRRCVKHDDQHCTLIAWSKQPFFLCRPTMEHVHGVLLEHVYGILLEEKLRYRSVHAAFVNTKWYEAWLERTLLLDPIIFDMFVPGVLSWAPGDPCNSHHARHDLSIHNLCSVSTPWVLFSITSRSVAAAAASSLSRFSCSPSCRGESLVGVRGRAWSRMTTTSVRARCVGRPSSSAEWCTVSVSSVQDTICSRHISRYFFLSHMTQSVQDMICQCLFLSRAPCQLLRLQ